MRTLLTLILSFILYVVGFGQKECQPYVPVEVGTKWEITNYNAKGKFTGKIAYELIEKTEEGNNITYTIENKTFDKKGKEVFVNTFATKCVDGVFQISMAAKMDGNQMAAYQNMDMDMDASDLDIPGMDVEPGTKLADGSLLVKVKAGGAIGINFKIDITDRTIDAKEEVTTPAGTFNCIVMSQTVSTKVGIKVVGSSKEWYSVDVGVVKSESYNKSGKLVGSSELTMLEKP